MKSTTFLLRYPMELPDQFECPIAKYHEPLLPAYAIEYAELHVHQSIDGGNLTNLLLGRDFEIDGDIIVWPSYVSSVFGDSKPPLLVIHYHGIRDYLALFPTVQQKGLKFRLSSLYEEAEKTFENSAWLCFIVVCGGIFEGLLASLLGDMKGRLSDLISSATKKDLIDESEAEVIERVRSLRNLVHPGRESENGITRADAMDTRKVLDDVIKRFSHIASTSSGKNMPQS